ncbi:DUF1294 domain-containing protein [Clostridium carnis]
MEVVNLYKLFIIYLIFINLFSLLLMYVDKQKAIKHKWRIKESTLMFISILGGSLGSLLGMNLFRHKTKHIKFSLGIPIIILIQVSLFIYFILKK